MTDFLPTLVDSFELLLDPTVVLLIIAGYLVGVVIGGLPGMGPTLAFGLVLPFTFIMDPVGAVAFLLAISTASMYSNSIPAILLGVPGSTAAVMTAIDGYALHRRGESGLALAVHIVGSVVGQFASIALFIVLVIPLARLAYYFLAPELFAVYMIGLMAVISLTGKHLAKGFVAAGVGLLIGVVGWDPVGHTTRLDFDIYLLQEGIPVAPVLIGLLAVSELFRQSRQVFQWGESGTRFKTRWPKLLRLKGIGFPIASGTLIGTFVGAMPGAGGTPAALISYQQAQVWSKTPQQFGNGSTQGIAANEAAQNASNAGELIPTIGFGIPGSGSMALLLGALVAHGFAPGPRLVETNPALVAGLAAGMVGGSILMALTGWWMAKSLLKIVLLNRSVVIVLSLAVVIVGVYSLNRRLFDVMVCVTCGVAGYVMLRFGYPTAPAALTAVLSTDIERNFRIGLSYTGGDIVGFVSRPYTALILGLAAVIALWGLHQQRKIHGRGGRANETLTGEAQVADHSRDQHGPRKDDPPE